VDLKDLAILKLYSLPLLKMVYGPSRTNLDAAGLLAEIIVLTVSAIFISHKLFLLEFPLMVVLTISLVGG
jgi:hypothetical protein